MRHCGLERCIYMCDQEPPTNSMMQAALQILGKTGTWEGAAPEHSAVGDSQANGGAESAVKKIEGHARTPKGALESRIRRYIPSTHPVIKCVIEHPATPINTYALHNDGNTMTSPYGSLHGKKASRKLAEFRERVLFLIPTKKRAPLDMPWSAGVPQGFYWTVFLKEFFSEPEHNIHM